MAKIVENKPNRFMTKSKFGYKNQAHDFEDATFEWVLKRLKPHDLDPDAYKNVTLEPIAVRVWDSNGPANPNLRLEFPPTKAGMKDARAYAQQILETGAVMAEVVVTTLWPWGEHRRTVEATTFENSDLI